MFFRRSPDLKKLFERQDVQGLIKALKTAREDVKEEIIKILADIRDPRATQALLREAESTDLTIRRLAAQALMKVDPEQKYLAAVHALSDMQRSMRVAALNLLGTLSNPKSLDLLTRSLANDREPMARAAAAKSLGMLKDRRGVNHLIDALGDEDAHVRQSIVEALGNIGDRAALSNVLRVSEMDANADVREAARAAAQKLTHVTL